MGDDLVAGQRPQVVVPAGVWQGSSTCGEWTLLGTTMAPPYADEGFELGRRDVLVADWPSAAERIAELTRG
jgi:predicted cupin superfamily sugar epimerase